MQRTDMGRRALAVMLLIALVLLAVATVMVPDVGPVAQRAWEASARPALEESLAHSSPVIPASSFGDPYYDWARFTAPAQRATAGTTGAPRVANGSRTTHLVTHAAPGKSP